MKRTINRVLARLAMFLVAIILGAIAVAQAQKGFEENRLAKNSPAAAAQFQAQPQLPAGAANQFAPIPFADAPPVQSNIPAATTNPPPQRVDSYEDDFSPPPPINSAPYPNSTSQDDFGAAGAYDGSDAYPDEYGPTDNSGIRQTAAEFSDDEPQFDEPPLTIPPARTEIELPAMDAQPEPSRTADTRFIPPPSMQFAPETPAPTAPTALTAPTAPPTAQPNSLYLPPPPQGSSPSLDRNVDSQDGSRGLMSQRDLASPAPNSDLNSGRSVGQNLPGQFSAVANLNDRNSASSGIAGVGKPGPPELEGPQTPALTITKKSPREVQVGKPARFHITVRNSGQIPAHDVLIRDEVPHGTQLIDTNPPAQQQADGSIVWQMGTLRPGAETTVMMELMPVQEGDIGSVATVIFEAAASARTIVTRPQLVLEHTAPRQVLVGEDVVFSIKLSNPGSGVATNVTIEENVPLGLQHYNGSELEYQVGDLKPGESRVLELTLKADQAGVVQNVLRARAEANLSVEDVCELEVVAPQLRVEITGPKKRFLERKASYEIHVANPGTAAAHNVELVAQLPRALKFNNTTNSGSYDPRRHVVVWNLAQLPAQEMGTVQVEATPMKTGDHAIQVDARANMGLSDSVEHQVSVEGIAALLYTVTDVSDPIEVGGQTVYEIQIVNQGSKTATNLQLGALIPPGMEPINGEGPTRVNINGPQVIFDPLARLEPQADTSYKIHVKGTSPGDKRVQVQLISDEITEPITKEESTHVYADE